MSIQQIADGVTTTGAQTTFTNKVSGIKPEGLLQVDISGSATCFLEGSLDGGTTWAKLTDDITASGMYAIMFPHTYRLNISANSGTVNAWTSDQSIG